MTNEQNSKLKELMEKHHFLENSVPYFLMLLGIGCDMETGQIEDYLFHDPKANMIQKDLRRLCLLLGFPLSILESEHPIQDLKTMLQEVLDKCKRYDLVFQKYGMTLEEVENGMFLPPVSTERKSDFYPQLLKRIMENRQFTSAQLDQLIKAVELSMPEEEILKFADPDKTSQQMEKYIEFYQLRIRLQPKDRKTNGWIQRLWKRCRKEGNDGNRRNV